MSDKNEYWKELFGEDFPEINDSELDSKLMKETIESELYTDDSEVFSLVSDTVSDNSSDYTWINIDNDQEDESEKTNVVSENDLKDLYEHANAYFSADDEKTSVVKLPKESDSTNAASHGNDKNDKTDDGVDEYFPPSFPKLFKRKSDKSEQQSDADKTASVKSTAASKSSAKYKTSKKTEGKKAIRRQRMSGCMIGLIYSAAVVCISVVLACLGWVAATDVFALNKDYITATVVIEENYTIDSVADELYDKGLIEYKFLFKLFAAFARVEEEQKIDPGTYQLNTTYDYRALVSNMQQLDEMDEDPNVVTVSFPEGMTIKQVFALLEENGVCSYDELLEAATNYDFDYEFLDSLELGNENRLEGYLFPDTYEFYLNESAEVAISRFLDNFNRKVSTQMYETAEDLGYSMHDIIIIASLIEKEASGDADRTDIASVIYNRLNSSDFPRLEIDATVQYALGEWKEELTYDDLNVDSPYNTYLYEGLPEGPIANPGLSSILAALDPADTDYYFYALHTDGTHRFFSDYDSFYAFINSSEFGG